MSFQSLITALKGGPGSGNFGHSGRPGKIGGSSSIVGVLGAWHTLKSYNNSGTELERHIVVDSAGNLIFDIEGQPHAVTMQQEHADKLDKLGGDFVDMHNHPSNNAPSSADYDSWLRFQPKEARVVTRNGTYILKPKNGVWFPGLKPDNLYGAGVSYYMSYNYYKSYGLTYPDGDQELLSRNALVAVAKDGWLDYDFIPHD